jgi:anti-anti-sigma factor
VEGEGVQVVVRRGSDHAIVSVRGSIFFDTYQVLQDALVPLATGEQPRIVLDLSGVDLCDSSGLNVMAQTHLMARQHGGWLRLAGAQPLVREVLDATRLTGTLPLYETVDQAIG